MQHNQQLRFCLSRSADLYLAARRGVRGCGLCLLVKIEFSYFSSHGDKCCASTHTLSLPVCVAQELDGTSQDLFSPDSCSTLSLKSTPPLETTPLLAQVIRGSSPPSLRFLQLLCELRQVGGQQRPLAWLLPGSGGDTVSLVVDSVCCLLHSVVTEAAAAAAGHPAHSPLDGMSCELVLEACRVASRATELLCSQGALIGQDTTRLEEPLARLTETLLNWNQMSGVSVCVLLGSTTHLNLRYSKMLRHTKSNHFAPLS